MDKEFVVRSISRTTLIEAGIPKEAAEKLTDQDMRQIASRIEDMDDFEDVLEQVQIATTMVMEFGPQNIS